MTKNIGIWTAEYEIEPGLCGYTFIVDGKWIADPANSITEGTGDRGNSIIEVN